MPLGGIAGVSSCNVNNKVTSVDDAWGLIASCGPLRTGKYSVNVDFEPRDNIVDLYFVRGKCNEDPTENDDEVRKWTGGTAVYERVGFTATESETYCFVLKNRNVDAAADTSLTLKWTMLERRTSSQTELAAGAPPPPAVPLSLKVFVERSSCFGSASFCARARRCLGTWEGQATRMIQLCRHQSHLLTRLTPHL